MVSSDFGKLEVIRHLISGEDCAIAGEATAPAAAAPVAETFKKSRRFIKASPCWGVSRISCSISTGEGLNGRRSGAAVFNTEGLARRMRPRQDSTDLFSVCS